MRRTILLKDKILLNIDLKLILFIGPIKIIMLAIKKMMRVVKDFDILQFI